MKDIVFVHEWNDEYDQPSTVKDVITQFDSEITEDNHLEIFRDVVTVDKLSAVPLQVRKAWNDYQVVLCRDETTVKSISARAVQKHGDAPGLPKLEFDYFVLHINPEFQKNILNNFPLRELVFPSKRARYKLRRVTQWFDMQSGPVSLE